MTLHAAGAGAPGFGAHVFAYYRRGRVCDESLPQFLGRLTDGEFGTLIAAATGATPASLTG